MWFSAAHCPYANTNVLCESHPGTKAGALQHFLFIVSGYIVAGKEKGWQAEARVYSNHTRDAFYSLPHLQDSFWASCDILLCKWGPAGESSAKGIQFTLKVVHYNWDECYLFDVIQRQGMTFPLCNLLWWPRPDLIWSFFKFWLSLSRR